MRALSHAARDLHVHHLLFCRIGSHYCTDQVQPLLFAMRAGNADCRQAPKQARHVLIGAK